MSDTLRRARARMWLRERAAAYLFDPSYGVTTVDYGTPVREQSGRDPRPTLRFHVPQKHDVFTLQSSGIRPVPEQIGEFETDVLEGSYRLETSGSPAGRFDPLRGGISISRLHDHLLGTLGGLVRDRTTGAPMILSNWHVLVVAWGTLPGRRICQPAGLDGGRARDVVATLAGNAMAQGLDAAVATLTDTRALVNSQLYLGPVTGVARPQIGMRLTKSGRRTGVTDGIITGVDGLTKLQYGNQTRLIRGVMRIEPTTSGARVSDRGDSGAWWLDDTTHAVVGLHFAGKTRPDVGLAMDMQLVLDALEVDIVTEQPTRMPALRPALPMEVLT